jgi:hypothetical protein
MESIGFFILRRESNAGSCDFQKITPFESPLAPQNGPNILAHAPEVRFDQRSELMVQGALKIALALATCLFVRAAESKPLGLFWVDVEGGAATLIVTPAGESILIDTGMPGERDPKRIVKAARDAGLEQIDHLITTHFHIDHFGGAADVAKELPIKNLYDYGIPQNNPDNPNDNTRWNEWIKPYREMNVGRRVVVKPGDSIPLKQTGTGPELSLRCIAAQQRTIPGKGAGAGTPSRRDPPSSTSARRCRSARRGARAGRSRSPIRSPR